MDGFLKFWEGLAGQLSYLGKLSINLLPGLQFTVGLFFLTVILSMPLGLLLALLRNSRVGSPPSMSGSCGGRRCFCSSIFSTTA